MTIHTYIHTYIHTCIYITMIISKIHLTCIRKASERQDPRTNHDTNSLVFTQGSLAKALQQK
jgi:hypothetical protein